ncbi:hypothetical protein JCM24511_08431 [Saitozyma sp. JCM 24511]|nr:hypothetical protein JCM24511_08431 [Saitozyma sp. JCM 24511]
MLMGGGKDGEVWCSVMGGFGAKEGIVSPSAASMVQVEHAKYLQSVLFWAGLTTGRKGDGAGGDGATGQRLVVGTKTLKRRLVV